MHESVITVNLGSSKLKTWSTLCKPTCVRFSANWAAVWRVWLSWESRLLWTELLSPTPFSWVFSEFCCDAVCPMAAKEARSRSVRERILSQTDSSSRDWCRCSSVSSLHKEDERVNLGFESIQVRISTSITTYYDNCSIPLFRVPAGENSQISVVPHIVPGDVVLLCRQGHGLHTLLQTQHTGKQVRMTTIKTSCKWRIQLHIRSNIKLIILTYQPQETGRAASSQCELGQSAAIGSTCSWGQWTLGSSQTLRTYTPGWYTLRSGGKGRKKKAGWIKERTEKGNRELEMLHFKSQEVG